MGAGCGDDRGCSRRGLVRRTVRTESRSAESEVRCDRRRHSDERIFLCNRTLEPGSVLPSARLNPYSVSLPAMIRHLTPNSRPAMMSMMPDRKLKMAKFIVGTQTTRYW